MKIGGLEKFTVTDYPGKISCIVFTVGCNFRCPFCHNKQLVTEEAEQIPEEDILGFLEKRKGQLEGVTLTGGEALIQSDLFDFLGRVKEMGYDIKIDTNGTIPETLKEVVRKRLVDYVAMDVKAPIDDYDRACGIKVNTDKIEESIDFVLGLESYEFRTTAVPTIIDGQAIEKIATRIEGAERFFIQQFKPRNTLDKGYMDIDGFKREKLEEFRNIAEKYVEECKIRNV